MASHTVALMRKWARYGHCDTCDADAGRPCVRKIPPRWRYRMDIQPLVNPHRGRPRSKETCGDDGGRQLRPNSTFACHLVPDHGGELHINWHAQSWPIGTRLVAA